MTMLAAKPLTSHSAPAESYRSDSYRCGPNPIPGPRPGTMGWTVADVEDPEFYVYRHQGRYEILNGVLTVMPPAYYYGGQCAANLIFAVRDHLRARRLPCGFSVGTDIRIDDDRVVRADAVAIFGDDLPRFRALRFPPPRTDWREHVLTIPPTLLIESVSRGHEQHDRLTKQEWYAELGVRHYWIVDAFDRRLDCLLLDGPAYTIEASAQGESGTISLPSLHGLTIDLADVWADPTASAEGPPPSDPPPPDPAPTVAPFT